MMGLHRLFVVCVMTSGGLVVACGLSVRGEEGSPEGAPSTGGGSSSDANNGQSNNEISNERGDASDDGGGMCGVGPKPSPVGVCPSVCNGGCAGDVCVIACGSTQCVGKVLTCPAGMPCQINCNGSEACDEAKAACPGGGYDCKVTCNGFESCEALDLQCLDGACSISCGTDTTSCKDTVMKCGTGKCTASCMGTSKPKLESQATSCSATGC